MDKALLSVHHISNTSSSPPDVGPLEARAVASLHAMRQSLPVEYLCSTSMTLRSIIENATGSYDAICDIGWGVQKAGRGEQESLVRLSFERMRHTHFVGTENVTYTVSASRADRIFVTEMAHLVTNREFGFGGANRRDRRE